MLVNYTLFVAFHFILLMIERKKEQVNQNKAGSKFTIITVSTVTGDWTRRVGLTNMGRKE